MTLRPERGPDDTFDFNVRPRGRAVATPVAPTRSTGLGRRLGTSDSGAVALAIGAMAFYWMLPAVLRKRHKPGPKASPPAS